MEVIKLPGNNRSATYYTCEANKGFYYRVNKRKNEKTFLICVNKGCPARAICDDNVFTKTGEGHNHLEDVTKGEVLLLKRSVVEEAIISSEDVKSIFVRKSSSVSIDVASKVAFPATAKIMRRERRRVQPTMPNTLQEYGEICEQNVRFGQLDGNPFCRGVVGQGDTLSVLFLSNDLKHFLADAKEMHLDGTFKTRPRHPSSNQLFTIMVVLYGYAFPCAFALMYTRKTCAYDALFEKLKELVPQLHPQLIMSDFEVALVASLERQFPLARKTGCHFHYSQALLRKSQSLGMTQLIKRDKAAKHCLKMLMSLPLMPSNAIEDGVGYITDFCIQKNILENFQTLLTYHRRQWLQKVGVNSLSVFKRARRTNNDCESFHATLKRLLRVQGPNVWEFTDGLRNISSVAAREINSFVYEGLQIRTIQKRRYRLNDKKIKRASKDFLRDNNIGRFLNAVCYSAERLVQSTLADDHEEDIEEEFLLVALADDIPPEFNIDTDASNDDEVNDSSPEDDELLSNEGRHQNEGTTTNEAVAASAASESTALCMICHVEPPTTVLLPCKHFGLCDECAKIRQELNNIQPTPEEIAFDSIVDHSICPLDRIHVEQYVRIIST